MPVLVQQALRLSPQLESPRNLHRAQGSGCLIILLRCIRGLRCQHAHIATVTAAAAAAFLRHRRRRERRRWASDDLCEECGTQDAAREDAREGAEVGTS